MTLHPFELIRRFLIHVLPKGLLSTRHYGLLPNTAREERPRAAQCAPCHPGRQPSQQAPSWLPVLLRARMLIIETFEANLPPTHPPGHDQAHPDRPPHHPTPRKTPRLVNETITHTASAHHSAAPIAPLHPP